MNDIPVLRTASERKQSIINNTPAFFNIEENKSANGDAPLYELDIASTVDRWCGLITHLSKKHGVSVNLARAIVYMETTHGWYDKLYPFKKTILPMNLHYKYWKDLGVTKELLGCPHYNIEFGILLLSRIQERVKEPSVRKVASIYNFLGAEKVTDYGARVNKLVLKKPWTLQGCAA